MGLRHPVPYVVQLLNLQSFFCFFVKKKKTCEDRAQGSVCSNYRSLLQSTVAFIRLFFKRDLPFAFEMVFPQLQGLA